MELCFRFAAEGNSEGDQEMLSAVAKKAAATRKRRASS
jgi:hypothetical protein